MTQEELDALPEFVVDLGDDEPFGDWIKRLMGHFRSSDLAEMFERGIHQFFAKYFEETFDREVFVEYRVGWWEFDGCTELYPVQSIRFLDDDEILQGIFALYMDKDGKSIHFHEFITPEKDETLPVLPNNFS